MEHEQPSARSTLSTALLLGLLGLSAAVVAAAQPVPAPAEPTVERGLGEPEGAALSGEELDEATYELSDRLRCPVCQGLSVAASPSPSALAMREEIRELLAAGYTDDQIVAYFEGAYGEFVRLVPKPEGFNLLVWIVPVIAVASGLLWVLLQTRRGRRSRGRGDESGEDSHQAAEDAELARYREEIRRRATRGGAGVP